jgi:hypothetical protein
LYYFVLFGLQPEPEPEAAELLLLSAITISYQCPPEMLRRTLRRTAAQGPAEPVVAQVLRPGGKV